MEDSGWGWNQFIVRTETNEHLNNYSPYPKTEEKEDNSQIAEDVLKNFNISTEGFSFTDFEENSALWKPSEDSSISRESRTPQPSSQGKLYAARTLDYEDETHRRGFRFLVQVTDRVSRCIRFQKIDYPRLPSKLMLLPL